MTAAQGVGMCPCIRAGEVCRLICRTRAVPGGDQREAIRVVAELELGLDAFGPPSASEQQGVRAVLLRHKDLEASLGHPREHAEQIDEIRLAGAVGADQNVEGPGFEAVERADRLEAANVETIESGHALPPGS